MGWFDDAAGFATGGTFGGMVSGAGGLNRLNKAEELYGGVDPQGNYQRAAFGAERFGLAGARGYEQRGQEAAAQRAGMQGLSDQYGRIAGGQQSVSAEQLRQGLMQNQGAQMSMAAGASPSNQAMAARTAAMTTSRLGAGLAGQQAVAGLQERQQAMGQQAQLQAMIQQGILGQRGQDVQASLGGQQNSLAGYGGIEDNRTRRYMAAAGAPTPGEQMLGAAGGVAGLAASLSDRRAKKNIADGEEEADELVKALRAKTWEYRDPEQPGAGPGRFLGGMAQDIEKTRAGKAIVRDTPRGKMIDGGRLAAALAAAMPGIDKRISKLERKRA